MGANKHQRSIDSITRKWPALAAIFTSPIFILFVYLGDPGRGMAAWISALAISCAARFLWDLKDRAWYWLTIAIILLLHVPVILLIPWTLKRQWTYVQFLPMAILDFGVAYGIIRLVEKMIEGAHKGDPTAA